MTDPIVSELPSGLWEQPLPEVPDLGGAELVQRIRVPASLVYDYTPGSAPSKFLRALAAKSILGGCCAEDTDVYVPPRGVSPVVGRLLSEMVEVGPNATVTSFCIVHIGFGENAPPTPFVSALILPDGAAVSLYGTVLGIALEDIRIGMRVRPVWAPDDQLATSFENITHWEPIDEPDVDAESLKGHM